MDKQLTIHLDLVREAQKKGGDRYEGLIPHVEEPFVVYLPQSISRPEGIALESMNVTFERE